MSRRFLLTATRCFGAATAVLLGAAAGCENGGETAPQPGSLEQPASEPAPGEDIFEFLGIEKPEGQPSFDFSSVEDPWTADTEAACVAANADNSFGPVPDAYRACVCANCMDLVHQCDALEGCREIQKCVLEVGCTDTNSCYLFPSATAKDPEGDACIEPIDRWGNTGFAVALINRIGECVTANNCPRE